MATSLPEWLSADTDCVRITLRATPRASRNRIEVSPTALRAYVTAAPEDGRANAALVKLLAKRLGVAKSAITLLRGESARDKTLQIDGLEAIEVANALAP